MAEAIGRQRLSALREDVEILSAGIAASEGAPASNHARFVVADRGGNLDGHGSRLLDRELLERADLVLTMTSAHRDAVRAMAKGLDVEIITLAELAGDSTADVSDPFGGSLELYERTYEQIESLILAARTELHRRFGKRS